MIIYARTNKKNFFACVSARRLLSAAAAARLSLHPGRSAAESARVTLNKMRCNERIGNNLPFQIHKLFERTLHFIFLLRPPPPARAFYLSVWCLFYIFLLLLFIISPLRFPLRFMCQYIGSKPGKDAVTSLARPTVASAM